MSSPLLFPVGMTEFPIPRLAGESANPRFKLLRFLTARLENN
jgi:hypothetical protein